MKKIIYFVRPCDIHNFDKSIAEVAAAGVDSIMLAAKMGDVDLLKPDDVAKAKRILAKFKVESPACHALWGKGLDLNEPDENQRREMIDAHLLFMTHATELGAKTYVCHPGRRAGADQVEWELVRRTLDKLVPKAESLGLIIALENDNPGGLTDNAANLAAFVENYDSPAIGVCLDSGHAHQNEGAVEALRILKPHVVTAHLHDNDQSRDQHGIIGEGTIVWANFVPLLWSCPRLIHVEIEAFNEDHLPPEAVYGRYAEILELDLSDQ